MCYVGKATKIFIFIVVSVAGIFLGFILIRRRDAHGEPRCSSDSCPQPASVIFPTPANPNPDSSYTPNPSLAPPQQFPPPPPPNNNPGTSPPDWPPPPPPPPSSDNPGPSGPNPAPRPTTLSSPPPAYYPPPPPVVSPPDPVAVSPGPRN